MKKQEEKSLEQKIRDQFKGYRGMDLVDEIIYRRAMEAKAPTEEQKSYLHEVAEILIKMVDEKVKS